MCESIKETYDHQNQSVRNHHHLISQAINNFSHNRCCKKAANCRYCKQQTNGGSLCPIKQNQCIGSKSKEHLLSCPIKHFQKIVLGILLPKIEPALVFVCFTVSLHLHSQARGYGKNKGRNQKESSKSSHSGNKEKSNHDHKITGQCTNLGNSVL